ncbi:MAG TPA: prolipoprotein diacylglyceryl transferase, partial [Acidimicrobiia bacterium]|nr:prolipoprotein diacylglyceryl transferase [Acidimicrobiia bacterium]
IGPLRVTFYGIFIMTGVVIAWLVLRSRFEARGGDPEIAERIVIRVVIFGFLGARLAYVSTHLSRFEEEWWTVIAIWEGGLALYGGLTVGAIVMYVYTKKWGASFPEFLDSAAPAVPLAQALGRFGNYFNQELFGTPTDLPGGLEIDPPFRPDGHENFATFHPTFLYESLWNVGLAFFIIWVGKRYPSLRGRLIGVYFLGYGLIRFLMELIRTDTSFRFLGLSRNGWVSIGVIILGGLVLWWQRLEVDEKEYTLA